MVTINDVWRTDAGGYLFNGITNMNLVDEHGAYILFSERLKLTKHVIGFLLEKGYRPEDMTSVIRPLSSED